MKSNRDLKPLPAGVILAPVNVGTKTTCPPGEICVGKSWGQGYCAIFGKETERVKNYSGKFKRTLITNTYTTSARNASRPGRTYSTLSQQLKFTLMVYIP